MVYRVELTARARRNLRTIHASIGAVASPQAALRFKGLLSAISNLRDNPARCPVVPEDVSARHLLYGSGRNVYRVIFDIDADAAIVNVLHVRHGSRQPLNDPRETPRRDG